MEELPPSSNAGSYAADAPIRALLLDDSTFDRARIRRLSEKANLNLKLDEVDSLSQMENAVDSAQYDLFLIDFRLPVGDGIEAINWLKQDPRNNAAGTIMITGNAKLDTAVHAMRSGYHDVLSKSELTAAHLRSSVRSAMMAAQKAPLSSTGITQLQLQNSFARAMTDPALQDHVAQIMSSHVIGRRPVAAVETQNDRLSQIIQAMMDDDEFDFGPGLKH